MHKEEGPTQTAALLISLGKMLLSFGRRPVKSCVFKAIQGQQNIPLHDVAVVELDVILQVGVASVAKKCTMFGGDGTGLSMELDLV